MSDTRVMHQRPSSEAQIMSEHEFLGTMIQISPKERRVRPKPRQGFKALLSQPFSARGIVDNAIKQTDQEGRSTFSHSCYSTTAALMSPQRLESNIITHQDTNPAASSAWGWPVMRFETSLTRFPSRCFHKITREVCFDHQHHVSLHCQQVVLPTAPRSGVGIPKRDAVAVVTAIAVLTPHPILEVPARSSPLGLVAFVACARLLASCFEACEEEQALQLEVWLVVTGAL